jgi:hypothetical protein
LTVGDAVKIVGVMTDGGNDEGVISFGVTEQQQ